MSRLTDKMRAFWNQYRNFIIGVFVIGLLIGMFITGPLLTSLAVGH